MESRSMLSMAYPFSAFAGNDLAKNAILCLLANKRIKSLLILGGPGTGKSVLSRSVASIDPDAPVVNVPVGTGDDRLFGTVDFEKAVSTGVVTADRGLFQEADGGVLCFDDIDLIDKRLVLEALDSAVSGEVSIEREGISSRYPCNVSLIATSTCPTRRLDPHMLDRFDVCVHMGMLPDGMRAQSLRNTLEFHEGFQGFFVEYGSKDAVIHGNLLCARDLLPKVRILKRHRDAIARICRSYGVASYRGAISCAQVARALAALGGRKKTSDEDLVQAVEMSLAHRRTKFEEKKHHKQDYEVFIYSNDYDMRYFIHDDRGMNNTVRLAQDMNEVVSPADTDEGNGRRIGLNGVLDIEAEVGRKFKTIDLLESADHNGENEDTRFIRYVESPNGRYSGFRFPLGPCSDMAVDATLRAAAVHQVERGRVGGRLKVEKQDVREKIRTKHVEQTFFFMMDTSGSLLIRGRFGKVKAAIISMLESHYIKRDRVGLMTFDGEKIELVLSPTRSTEQLSHTIDGIKAGRETPLSEALVTCWDFISNYRKKHSEEKIHIVLFTDGKSTIPLEDGNDPCEEALDVASHLKCPLVDWIVIDTGLDYTKNEMPGRLAESLGGRFFLLDEVESKDTVDGLWKPVSVEIYTKRICFGLKTE